MVKNYMETLVDQYLEELLHSDERYSGICTCEKCMDDIRAIALNHIQPFYITCKKGEIYGEFSMRVQQNKLDILREIVSAVETVSKNKHQ